MELDRLLGVLCFPFDPPEAGHDARGELVQLERADAGLLHRVGLHGLGGGDHLRAPREGTPLVEERARPGDVGRRLRAGVGRVGPPPTPGDQEGHDEEDRHP